MSSVLYPQGSHPLTFDKVSQNPLFARLYNLSRRQTDSVCLLDTKKMSYISGIPLAGRHISETVAWIDHFSGELATDFA